MTQPEFYDFSIFSYEILYSNGELGRGAGRPL